VIKLIVYDLDGTLIDSAGVVVDLLNALRKNLNKTVLEKEELIPWLSLGGEKMIEKALEINALDASTYLKKFRTMYAEIPTTIKSIYPGVIDVLDTLYMNYDLAICTNKPRVLAEKVLREARLSKYFSYVQAGDDLITKKPHPDNLYSCIGHFSVKSNEVILVGDSTIDQELARLCDVHFVHYSLGYDDGVKENKFTYRINDHAELLPIIAGL
jgi:phosphoglycolate phosphatase